MIGRWWGAREEIIQSVPSSNTLPLTANTSPIGMSQDARRLPGTAI
jgi:hypothetical protein